MYKMKPPPHPCWFAAPSKKAHGVFVSIHGGGCGRRSLGGGGSGSSLNADIIPTSICGQWVGLLSKIWRFRAFQMCQVTRIGRFIIFVPLCLRAHSSHADLRSSPSQCLMYGFEIDSEIHRSNITLQCRKRCSVDSDAPLQSMHQVGPWKALCESCSPIGTLFLSIHQKNILVLGGAMSFQMLLHQEGMIFGFLCKFRTMYPTFGEYFPFSTWLHISSSGPSLILIWDSFKAVLNFCHSWCHLWGRFIWCADLHFW